MCRAQIIIISRKLTAVLDCVGGWLQIWKINYCIVVEWDDVLQISDSTYRLRVYNVNFLHILVHFLQKRRCIRLAKLIHHSLWETHSQPSFHWIHHTIECFWETEDIQSTQCNFVGWVSIWAGSLVVHEMQQKTFIKKKRFY